jgi:hypothetical protein
MRVEFGCPRPVGRHDDPRPVIAYLSLPDHLSFKRDVDAEHWRRFMETNSRQLMRSGVLPAYEGSEVLCQLTHPNSPFNAVSDSDPTWVWSDDADAARFCSEFFQIPIEARDPNDLSAGHSLGIDETHWRKVGGRLLAPGVPFVPDATGLLTNVGATLAANNVGGGQTALVGKGTAASSTTFTTNLTLTTNAWAGYRLYVADTTNGQVVWGNVISNTNASGASVVTVDQWYTNSGSAATTPAAGFEFILADGGAVSAWFMGITTTNITPAATDTSLSGEATANGMGRALASFTVISAASGSSITFTVSNTFTFTGSTPTTFYALGLFNSAVKADTTDTMFFETSFTGSFTVSNDGDTAVVTDTITLS